MLKIDLTQLGFEPESLDIFKKAIARPWGIILVTRTDRERQDQHPVFGHLHPQRLEKNIMTAEDPVEFYIPGINQVNIRDEINLNFATALRAFLRQDPDIMLVGEMRDTETVDIAIKAALTGHLVFSTIHTNDSASTVHRLMNMNIEPFLIADSVMLIVAQRLVRKRLQEVRRPGQAVPPGRCSTWASRPRNPKAVSVMQARGCDACNGTGYKGRTGLFEVMEVTPPIRDLILARGQSREHQEKRPSNTG